MICAYCEKDKPTSKEHIISQAVLDLFPECDLTYDDVRGKVYKSEPVINDVCEECNNTKLSYIDSYAAEFISRYFLNTYNKNQTLEIKYKYSMLQKLLMKYAYNDLRVRNRDTSYFTKDVMEFILEEEKTILDKKVTILSGLAINTAVMPEFFMGNKKLQWIEKPVFISDSLIERIDYITGRVINRKKVEVLKIDGLQLSYLFKFNSGIFILLCWDDTSEKYKDYEDIIPLIYPYKVLQPNDNGTAILERCTHAYNFYSINLIDTSVGMDLADQTNSMMSLDLDPDLIRKNLSEEWFKFETRIREEHHKKKEHKKQKKKKHKK